MFRNLRNLSVPPYGYVLPSTPCNEHAKQWVASRTFSYPALLSKQYERLTFTLGRDLVYDKMFEIPLSQTTEGNKARFFLFIKMSTD